MKLKTCTQCGGKDLKQTLLDHQREVGGTTFEGEVPGRVCAACGQRYYDLTGLQAFDLKVAVRLAANGVATGEAMRFMRRLLGLKAARLAGLLSLTAETISRIETGKLPADARTVALVGSLVLDKSNGKTDTLDRLEAIAKVEQVREKRAAGYRRQLKRLPPGPERDRIKNAMQAWLSAGPKRRESLDDTKNRA